MSEVDVPVFFELLDEVWSLKQQVLSANQKAVFFRALQQFRLEDVRAGLDAHIKDPRRGTFLPMPADVIHQIENARTNDGRPGAEEAWAIAVAGADESMTVVWTAEIAQAWGIARTVFDLGDEVGARVAFRDAYNRLVIEARMAHRRPAWSESFGTDPQHRVQAVSQAIALGRMQPEQLPLLEPPRGAGAGLDKLMGDARMPEETRLKLLELRDRFSGKTPAPDKLPDAVIRTRELQQETQARVDQHLSNEGEA